MVGTENVLLFRNPSNNLFNSRRRLSGKKTVSKAERARFLFSLFTIRFWGIAEATIEDLAF
ncbi:MAG: hypothetical protein KAU46_03185 [Candidatus Aminicenantes bacterium]|nr:hypothetical protein [Candidatus Aminicenantes bacterium]